MPTTYTTSDLRHMARQYRVTGNDAIGEVYERLAELEELPAGWRIVNLKTCFALREGNETIATLAGPDAEQNATRIAHAIQSAKACAA